MPTNNNYSTVYYSGAGGYISINGDKNAVIKEWTASFSVEAYGADTFNNPANNNGLIFKRKDMLGLAEGEISVTGYAVNPNEGIQLGMLYNVELGFAKPTSSGRKISAGQCICTKVEWKISADGNSPAEFSATFVPRGAVDI